VWCHPILHETLDIKQQTSRNELSTGLTHHAQCCLPCLMCWRENAC
jgi:hypothetical protein